MFYGKYSLQLSDNNKLTLPTVFGKAMSGTSYITKGFDQNLILLPQEAFNTIYSHVKATSISDPLARLLNRLFLGSAVEIPLDNAGQIDLPDSLREYAGLGKEIVIVGQGEYIEIWSTDLWDKQVESMNDFDANTHRFDKFNVSLV